MSSRDCCVLGEEAARMFCECPGPLATEAANCIIKPLMIGGPA